MGLIHKNAKKDAEKQSQKEDIEELGLKAIKEYFQLAQEQMDSLSPSVLHHLHHKAKLGMQFEKEVGVSKRAIEMNYIRVFRMIAEDKKELKNLIRNSLPKYYPG